MVGVVAGVVEVVKSRWDGELLRSMDDVGTSQQTLIVGSYSPCPAPPRVSHVMALLHSTQAFKHRDDARRMASAANHRTKTESGISSPALPQATGVSGRTWRTIYRLSMSLEQLCQQVHASCPAVGEAR